MSRAARGRSKPGAIDKPWKDALALALNERDAEGVKMLRRVAEACVKAAIDGDVAAMKEIGDRMDGKATQPIDVSGDGMTVLAQAIMAARDRARAR